VKVKHRSVSKEVDFAQEWQEGKVMFVIRDPDGLPWEFIQSSLDVDGD